MNRMWIVRGLLIVAIIAILVYQQFEEPAAPIPPAPTATSESTDASSFDFYVLALSWSPSYCRVTGDQADRQQCGRGSNHHFIVHGLWPQFERGYPEFCPTGRPQFVPSGLEESLFDIMPSRGLIRHQWRKHGTCSGLDQRPFFQTTRSAWEKVVIPRAYRNIASEQRISPKAMEDAFIRSNPGLPADGIAVTCGKRYLREVRICMTKDLEFRQCDEVDRNSCSLRSALLPAPN